MSEKTDTTISSELRNKEVRGRMKTKEEVQCMLQLHRQGYTANRIATLMGCSRNTVVRYLQEDSWRPQRRRRRLDGLESWLKERFVRHAGNADVVRQELLDELGVEASLRTVERALAPLRRELKAARLASAPFETEPGEQLQIDFGVKPRVAIGDRRATVHVFVATLGWSRRQYVAAYEDESQRAWFDGVEGAFRHFDGVPKTVLMDNPKALVLRPRSKGQAAVFNPRLEAFARHWGFKPKACFKGRAQTKGKDERSVGYVKHNAIAGREFDSWGHLDRHLERWLESVADVRVHGATGEAPLVRFMWERPHLAPLLDRPSFGVPTDLTRKASVDCMISLDTNRYSVPWRLVGQTLRVSVTEGKVRVYRGVELVACHPRLPGRHGQSLDPDHFADLGQVDRAARLEASENELTRPLSDYELIVEELSS